MAAYYVSRVIRMISIIRRYAYHMHYARMNGMIQNIIF